MVILGGHFGIAILGQKYISSACAFSAENWTFLSYIEITAKNRSIFFGRKLVDS